MAKEEAKAQEEQAQLTVEKTPEGKVYNFTRHGFITVAKNRKQAEEALKNYLKEAK